MTTDRVRPSDCITCTDFPCQDVYHEAYQIPSITVNPAAIQAVNYIAKRRGLDRVIPAGSTCKIRGPAYWYGGVRAFPSYLQAGSSSFIEKSKRRMIAEDIAAALRLAD